MNERHQDRAAEIQAGEPIAMSGEPLAQCRACISPHELEATEHDAQ